MHRLIAVVVATFVCGIAASKDRLDLATLDNWSLIVAEDAIPSERYAAEEFQSLLKQTVGIELPILHAPRSADHNIYIGPGRAMAESPVGFETGDLGEEGLRIRVQGSNIAIAGGRPRGTLYGVYEFAERYLGVRFLTWDHTYIPEKKAWAIPCESYTYVPPFSFRWSYYKENADRPDFAAKLRVNTTTKDEKLGGITRQSLINHSLYWQLPVEKYGESHPEYFALVDGERVLEMHGGGPEPCVTNPDVIEVVAKNVIERLDKDPGQKNISVSQNDNSAYCRCDRCEAINQREGTPMGSHLAFVNAVAERVEKKHPDVKIGTLAYWYTRQAPKTIRPRKNIQIQLCSIECCTLHAINDPNCAKNQAFCKDVEDWGAISDDIWIWNYNTNFHAYDQPHPNLRGISKNVQYFLEKNAKGLFMQANGNGNTGELCDLRNYVISRCIWNPEHDGWDLVEEFCDLHYKKAAKPILDYLVMLHDNAEELGCHPGTFPMPQAVGLRPEISRKAFAYFERAMELADDAAVRSRVEKASICAYKAILETCGVIEFQDNTYTVRLPEGYEDVFDRYVALAERHNLTRTAEGETASSYIERTRKTLGKQIQANQIENETWKLTIVPEEKGKVVEMLHKPSGRNVLVPSRVGSLSDLFQIGTIREIGQMGFGQRKSWSFEAEATPKSVRMTAALDGGSSLERKIWLSDDAPEKVFFETTIYHRGDDSNTYQFKLIPHFHTMTKSEDHEVVTAYIKNDKWAAFNQDWNAHSGPLGNLLKQGSGAFALFNHQTGCGILETYDPKKIGEPQLWWDPAAEQANLELVTVPTTLQKGESFSYGYQFEYLDKPPK